MKPTMNQKLLQEAVYRKELDALVSILQTTDRVLANGSMNVNVHQSDPHHTYDVTLNAGAWTDGTDIWLNGSVAIEKRLVAERIESFIATIKGLNYHELAHIVFTPSLKGDIANSVISFGRARANADLAWWCFNALEDQKAEMLFGRRYKLAYSYFKHTNLEYILRAKKQDFSTLLPLEHGRLFLPSDLRMKLFKLYADKHGLDKAKAVAEVVEKYIVLNTSTSLGRDSAVRLVMELFDLLYHPTSAGTDLPATDSRHFDSGQERMSPSNTDPGDKEREELENELDKDEAVQAAHEDEPEDEPEDDSNDDEDGGDSTETKDEPKFVNKSQVPGADDDLTPQEKAAIDGIKEDAEIAKDEQFVQGDSSFAEDLKKLTNALKSAVGGPSDQKMGSFLQLPITADMNLHQPRLLNVLRKLRLDSEPMWFKGQSSGNVDPERAALLDETFDLDIFDLWDEGSEEEGGIEVVVCLDLSSSMWRREFTPQENADLKSGKLIIRPSMSPMEREDILRGRATPQKGAPIVDASQSVWMLKRTLDSLEIPVTVLGFNDKATTLYTQTETANESEYRLFDASGGTMPFVTIQEATDILMRSKFNNRVLVVVTDGQWFTAVDSEKDADKLVELLRSQGAHTLLLGIGSAVSKYGDHGFELATDIDDIDAIAEIVESLVAQIMLRAIGMVND